MPPRFTEAVKRLDGDASLLREMALMTMPEFKTLTNHAHESALDGRCDQAVRDLHKLKGMLSTFESDGVVLEIQEVIQAGRNQNAKNMVTLLEQTMPAIEELIDAVENFSRV